MKIFKPATIIAAALTLTKVEGFTEFVGRAPRVRGLRMAAENVADDDTTVCLITGSSRGIGKSIALELCKDPKAKICINYITGMEEDAEAAVKEIEDAGGEAIAVKADVSKREEIEAMFKEIMAKYGKVDVLVNNAGISRDGLMLRMKPEQWQSVIDLNLSGVYYTSQVYFKHAVKNKTHGRVVNIASVSGLLGNAGQANYSAAKAGVIGLTMSNAREFASRDIKVNAICPGFIATEMTKKMGDDVLDKIKKDIPLGRLGTPEEVAGMVRFLAMDPAGDYVTGHCFTIDGGIAIGTS